MVKHRIVLTGGGTGGHVYPALSVAEQLKEDPDVEAILYIGARDHLEERLAAERNLDFIGLSVGGMPRKFSLKMLTWPIQMLTATLRAKQILADFKPTAVLGTGGYASAPPLAAAWLSGVPYAIHEPDAHPGLVNRAFGGNAKLVSLGMEGAAEHFHPKDGKIVANGNPVSKNFVTPIGKDSACAVFGLRPGCATVLITGGSQGAQAVNETVLQALPKLLEMEPPIQIIHQVGEKNFASFKQRLDPSAAGNPLYHLRPYFDDLSVAYAVSDLTVCRAGAMTISELAVTGTPAIFIPYPFAAQDHQTFNANFVAAKGAARVLTQSKLNVDTFIGLLSEVLSDHEKLHAMRVSMQKLGKPAAAANLAANVKELSTNYQSAEGR
jgi:UDP-N-acetylglucosamine--N-acetylmuramyl-(pentapeptide) pyrophosphoryl-undecaprenol N-acetylglucosamine transferase